MFEDLNNQDNQSEGNLNQNEPAQRPPQQNKVDDIFAETDSEPTPAPQPNREQVRQLNPTMFADAEEKDIATKRVGLSADQDSFSDDGKKKGEKTFVIIVAVMVVVIVALLGFLVYNKFFKGEEPTDLGDVSQIPPTDQVDETIGDEVEDEGPVDYAPILPGEDEDDFILDDDIDSDDTYDLNGDELTLQILEDSDGDLLNDEEELLLGSNINRADSDGDGHDDLTEVLNGYDPIGPGLLSENPNIRTYSSDILGISFLYPSAWQLRTVGDSLAITASDNSLFTVEIESNSAKQSILAWYAESVISDVPTSDRIKYEENWEGVYSEDGLYFYLTDKARENIYTFSYQPSLTDRIAYPNLFKMMINSFEL